MKLYLIFNPNSGKELLKKKLYDIVEVFSAAGMEITLFPTEKSGDVTEKIKEITEKDYDLAVVSGGDGTLNEAVNGLMQCQRKIPLGYIPTGTCNDFAKTYKIPKNLKKAAEIIVNGNITEIDVGLFNEKHFAYSASFGAFTGVAYETPQSAKNMFGQGAYFVEILKSLPNLRAFNMHIEHDEGVLDGEFVVGMVTNTFSIGGTLKQSKAILDDGLFEVTLVKMPDNVFQMPQISQGLNSSDPEFINKFVTCFRTKNVTFYSPEEDIKWCIDGEFAGKCDNVAITDKQKALQLFVPKKIL